MTGDRWGLIGYRLAQLGALVTAVGGSFDALVRKLLPHHEAYLGVATGGATAATSSLVLLLLHTLGVSLVAVGIGALALLADWRRSGARTSAIAAAGMVGLAEAMNAWAIWRVGSMLFVVPLLCMALVVGGVAMALRAHP
jgi:hypothetical protein